MLLAEIGCAIFYEASTDTLKLSAMLLDAFTVLSPRYNVSDFMLYERRTVAGVDCSAY